MSVKIKTEIFFVISLMHLPLALQFVRFPEWLSMEHKHISVHMYICIRSRVKSTHQH